MTILLWLSYTGSQILCHEHWWFHAFCLHINSGCLSSLWPTHSSQDKEQSTTKLVLLQKAKTMGITRPPSSLAKQVSRATRQKVRNYGPLDNNMPFILSFLCLQCDSLWRTFCLTDSVWRTLNMNVCCVCLHAMLGVIKKLTHCQRVCLQTLHNMFGKVET